MHKGATGQDWAAWRFIHQDILPWVCDPNIPKHPKSSITVGDTVPSTIRYSGEAAGIAGWAAYDYTTALHTYDEYATHDNYGILIKGRTFRAIDIDIVEPVLADSVHAFIEQYLNITLPFVRTRQGVSKRILLVRIDALHVKKHIVVTPHGPIEFLGDRQQYALHGTRADGSRYEWPNGVPSTIDDVPIISADSMVGLAKALHTAYGIAPKYKTWVIDADDDQSRLTFNATQVDSDDAEIEYLSKEGYIRSIAHDGKVFIRCPWEDEHTSTKGEEDTSTVFFPKGLGGLEQSVFKCLHAHCADRTTHIFKQHIGLTDYLVDAQLPQVDIDEVKELDPDHIPTFKRNRAGEIVCTPVNMTRALGCKAILGMDVRFDHFTGTLMYREDGGWEQFSDDTYSEVRLRLCVAGFTNPPLEMTRAFINLYATQRAIDSGREWIKSLKWDGVSRIQNFMADICKTKPDAYAQAVSLYLWTALAGRMYDIGVKTDMAPILISAQGTGKSTLVKNIAPHEALACDIDFDKKEDDITRMTRGKVIVELGELKGMSNADIRKVKAWMTRTHDLWVPKFKEFAVQHGRRFVCVGTTNETKNILRDNTGERRWLPIHVAVLGQIAVDDFVAEREQYWAEALVLYRKHGVLWQDANALAEPHRQAAKQTSVWDPLISSFVMQQLQFGNVITTADIIMTVFTRSAMMDGRVKAMVEAFMSRKGFTEDTDGCWSNDLI